MSSMSLKQEIETWVAALARYDNNEFEDAIAEFEKISDTSKILFNVGVIHATLGEHEKAVECYQRAIRLDQYLAIAYFQQGVSNFLIGDFEEALANFNDTLLYLRGNNMIDYYQLGLLFKLYSCEVLFNRGLCYIYLQQKETGMQDLYYAVREKIVEDHNVIDEAIAEQAEGYTVFSIPVGVVYRPNEAKVRNLKTKDYLGKARLVAASDRSNTFTGFTGSEIKNAPKPEPMEYRPPETISFTASNLVKPGLTSRRQQSEPPTNRSIFPPTPPPENASPVSGASNRGSRPSPGKLTIQTQDANRKYEKSTLSPERRPTLGRSSSAVAGSLSRDAAPPPLRSMLPRSMSDGLTSPEEGYDPYDVSSRASRSSRGSKTDRHPRSRPQPSFIREEDEISEYASIADGEFEMVAGGFRPSSTAVSEASRGPSRRPDVRKIRIKVHAGDVRYLVMNSDVQYLDLVEKVRQKLSISGRFKIKVQDEDMPEGDMITVGDQDDLDMVIQTAKTLAAQQRVDTAKAEIWVFSS